tara:strand:+ start:645 stop:932 length:288 start_codon:yes stop_codon:yes gene_type:complete
VLGIRHAVEAGGSRCGICNGAEWRTLRAAELRGQATSLLTYQVTKLRPRRTSSNINLTSHEPYTLHLAYLQVPVPVRAADGEFYQCGVCLQAYYS